MIALAFTMVLVAVATGAGWTVLGRLDRGFVFLPAERGLASFCLGTILLYWGVMAVGPIRLDGPSMAAVLAGTALIAVPAWLGAFRAGHRWGLAGLRAWVADMPLAARVLWAVVAVCLVLLLCKI